ncbi:2Fe-2S iron-sulfur cluster binding domain-containing protein [Alteromonas antoniana]|uniref:2Fe-2S iron-sulfur cluster binding domain-containing protein n=1 Tax=Alteromonas antoniana TaxID=2803813 RepID=UPI001C4395BA|nr:2Fe-2S iron-sulfur cluster binding domain-containing protein [Alteromonas antoniana]
MNDELVEVEIDVISEAKLTHLLRNVGIQMPVQCCEGFCGTCVVKADPSQFTEIHDQLGCLNPDQEILACSVKPKSGISRVVIELPGYLVQAYEKSLEAKNEALTAMHP